LTDIQTSSRSPFPCRLVFGFSFPESSDQREDIEGQTHGERQHRPRQQHVPEVGLVPHNDQRQDQPEQREGVYELPVVLLLQKPGKRRIEGEQRDRCFHIGAGHHRSRERMNSGY